MNNRLNLSAQIPPSACIHFAFRLICLTDHSAFHMKQTHNSSADVMLEILTAFIRRNLAVFVRIDSVEHTLPIINRIKQGSFLRVSVPVERRRKFISHTSRAFVLRSFRYRSPVLFIVAILSGSWYQLINLEVVGASNEAQGGSRPIRAATHYHHYEAFAFICFEKPLLSFPGNYTYIQKKHWRKTDRSFSAFLFFHDPRALVFVHFSPAAFLRAISP